MEYSHKLQTGIFQVAFSARPGIACLGLTGGAACLPGNAAALPNLWTIYSTRSETYTEIPDDGPQVRYALTQEDAALCWAAEIQVDGESLRAQIRAEVTGDTVRFTLGRYEETEHLKIVMFRLAGLASASQEFSTSRLALPAHGGRLIDPARCADGQMDHRYNWILDSFGSAAIVYTDRMTAVVRVQSMDDQLTSTVGGGDRGRFAQVGALLRHRYTVKDPSYRRAKPNRDPANLEDLEELPIEREFAVAGETTVTIDLLTHAAGPVESGWIHGAMHIRDSLPGKRTDLYRDRMVYKIFVDAPGIPVQTNLSQIRALVMDLAARTGNAGQLPYLVGFQHQGHDSAYPDVFTLNPALESVEALAALAQEARRVGCLISFHDNFDDAYADSPSWNADDISRDNQGHLLRGGIWNGAQAYWNSMPYYDRNRATQRIQKTLETYPFLHESYHLDVLTASVFRIDFRGGDPTGRQRDLEARLGIVEKFREAGLDVSSEACGLPFVGGITYFWHMQRIPRSLYAGDLRIPMVPFLVHGKADYAGTHTDTPRNILDGLLYGGFYCNDVTAATPIKELTDAYYMVQAPLNLIRDDLAVSYVEENGWKTVRYASGAQISVQFESEECAVDIQGMRVLENGVAMLPQADGSTLLYRSREEPYAPVLWNIGCPAGTKIRAVPLGVELPEEMLIADPEGRVPVELPVGVGYRAEAVRDA